MTDPFSTSSDLLRRIHISPSKNPMISKPPVLLSPRRPERRLTHTPNRPIQRNRYAYGATQSLDRNYKSIRISEFSPLDERVINAPIRRVNPYSTSRRTRPLTSINLTSRLKAEACAKLGSLIPNKDKDKSIQRSENSDAAEEVPKKCVKFQLPEENAPENREGNSKEDELNEIRQLLLEVINHQKKMEEDIKLIKSLLQER